MHPHPCDKISFPRWDARFNASITSRLMICSAAPTRLNHFAADAKSKHATSPTNGFPCSHNLVSFSILPTQKGIELSSFALTLRFSSAMRPCISLGRLCSLFSLRFRCLRDFRCPIPGGRNLILFLHRLRFCRDLSCFISSGKHRSLLLDRFSIWSFRSRPISPGIETRRLLLRSKSRRETRWFISGMNLERRLLERLSISRESARRLISVGRRSIRLWHSSMLFRFSRSIISLGRVVS
mmetsp:Transcript_13048/g.23676  ORF Transcript_13048/g.23676 Transcript_13048/m.23676 type:complete len:239 (-) Transcript_13048:311-1027(-)